MQKKQQHQKKGSSVVFLRGLTVLWDAWRFLFLAGNCHIHLALGGSFIAPLFFATLTLSDSLESKEAPCQHCLTALLVD